MQLIIENSDQFDQNVVDDALIDLNSQMHVPIMDEDEVNVLSQKEPTTVDQVANSINSTNEENTKTTNDTGDENLTNVPVANDEDESLVNNTNNPVSSIDDLISNSSKDDDSLV